MRSTELIAEGRALERRCAFLLADGEGPVAARWYERDEETIEASGRHCWLTVDSRHVPGLASSVRGYLSVFTDEEDCKGGSIQQSADWPNCQGTELYIQSASVLPPIDAVFARGSSMVGTWLQSCGWDRTDRYNDNFPDADVVREYERVWQSEHPLYSNPEVFAVLGGWHFPFADEDWHTLIDEQLLIFTLRDAEPWVEAWRTRDGQLRVIQRIT